MAHFAKISLNSKVLTVLTLNNEDMLNDDGVEDETVGQQYLERHNLMVHIIQEITLKH